MPETLSPQATLPYPLPGVQQSSAASGTIHWHVLSRGSRQSQGSRESVVEGGLPCQHLSKPQPYRTSLCASVISNARCSFIATAWVFK